MKGSADTHCYSERGKESHDKITWNNTIVGVQKCRYQKIKSNETTCLYDSDRKCPAPGDPCNVRDSIVKSVLSKFDEQYLM